MNNIFIEIKKITEPGYYLAYTVNKHGNWHHRLFYVGHTEGSFKKINKKTVNILHYTAPIEWDKKYRDDLIVIENNIVHPLRVYIKSLKDAARHLCAPIGKKAKRCRLKILKFK